MQINLLENTQRLSWHTSSWKWFDNAQNSARVPQGILLHGASGVGKRQFAAQLVRELLVNADAVPETQRENRLHQLLAGAHPDFNQLTPVEGKNIISVAQVRELTNKVVLTASYGGSRVIVIEPAESMNSAAANALLKCLEEPPAGTIFILISDRPSGLPITIRSRCQQIGLAAPTLAQAKTWLQQLEPGSADQFELALALSGNAPLLAQKMLSSGELPLFIRLRDGLEQRISKQIGVVGLASSLVTDPKDLKSVTQLCDWLALLLNVLLRERQQVPAGINAFLLSPQMRSFAKALEPTDVFDYLRYVLAAKAALAGNANPLLTIESLLVPWSRKLRIR